MDKGSQIFKRGFSLRQAFTITNLVILSVGTTFTVIILGAVIESKRMTVDYRLAKELAVSGSAIDTTFDDARAIVRALILGMPLILDRSETTFSEWMRIQAEIQFPKNPAVFDIYFGFAEHPARRMFKKPAMAFSVRRNIDYFSTLKFETPATFQVDANPNPDYQTEASEIWYARALASPGMVRTPFYYDTTYIKRVMISMTEALHDNRTGKILGVAGVDLTAGSFGKILEGNPIGATGGVFLIDTSGKPLAPFLTHDIPMLGFKWAANSERDPAFRVTPVGSPTLSCQPGTHRLVSPDRKVYVYQAMPLREPGFCLVAYQEQSEAYASLYWTVSVMILFSVVFLLTSLFFRQLLAGIVIANITKILENINVNREHFTETGLDRDYRRLEPEGPREIARIAHQLNLLYQRLQLSFGEVRAEKDRAELATKAKSRFLSVMSHEIRTPLNAMLGLTEVLLYAQLSPEQFHHLKILQRSGQSLLRILNDILDFSRLEAGKLQIELHEFDLYELLSDVEGLMRFDAEAKGLRFRVRAPSADYRLIGDSVRIRQALLNFTGNAIKFTAKGSIEIRVSALPNTLGGERSFKFAVVDTGIGISEDQQSKLFSEFAQADASITRRYGGSGLGLSISRMIVELLGGEISVQSEPGKGSVFQFTIPLKVLRERAAEYRETPSGVPERGQGKLILPPNSRFKERQDASPPENSGETRASVLVVDDDEDNHQLISAYMKFRSDIRAVHAYSAKDALAKFREGNFGLVLMDMQMPEKDGIDATLEIRRIERDEQRPRRPIVMISANTFAEDHAKSLAAGADEHVPKPIRLDQFQEILRRYFPTA